MAFVMAAAAVAGTAMSAYGMFQQGEAKRKQAEYQQGIAKLNEQISKQNADYARRVGEVQAQQSGMKSRFALGTQKAVQSGRGIDIESGSPALVREGQHDVALHDEAIIRSNAAWRAYGYEVEGVSASASGRLAGMAGAQAEQAGTIGAAGSILSGASSVADKWYQYSNTFGPPADSNSAGHHGFPDSSGM